MQTVIKKAIRDESGKVLILALILLVVGGLIMGPLLGLMGTGLAAGRVYENKTSQLYAADAGLEDAINWLVEGRPPDWPWTGTDPGPWQRSRALQINDNSVNVTIEVYGPPDSDTYKITSTATEAGRSTTVTSVVSAKARFKGCYLTGNQTLGNQSGPLTGDIIVEGDIELENSYALNITGAFIDGNLHLANQSELTLNGGVVCVTGNITMGQNTEISGDIHFLGSNCRITIEQPQSSVTGNIWADGNLDIRIILGSNSDEMYCPAGIYAPHGSVSVYLDKSNSNLVGDIYARWSIDILKGHDNAEHSGEVNFPYVGDAPFSIAPCPEMPTSPVIIRSYEVT